jgi:hypothetical protein
MIKYDIMALIVGSIATGIFAYVAVVMPALRTVSIIAVCVGIVGIIIESLCLRKRLRKHITAKKLLKAIDAVLNEQEKDVINKRYGLFGNPINSFDTIAKDQNISRERVRHIERISMIKVKKYLEIH